jgi:hypothetical protein
MSSIIIIIDYFGKWPEWFPLFIESCRANPSVNWLFHTDCDVEELYAENVTFKKVNRQDQIKFISNKLRVNFNPSTDYKFCDLKPMVGYLYEMEIADYDFFGYGDIDLIYGDIRKFYPETLLSQYSVLSTHDWCVSGHLALFRNVRWLREAFRKFSSWRAVVEEPEYIRFDEDTFSRLFLYPRRFRGRKKSKIYDFFMPLTRKFRRRALLKEQFTTPLIPAPWKNNAPSHPLVWIWKDGRITNTAEGEHNDYIYLHFMNYKYARFMDSKYGEKAFWSGRSKIVHFDSKDSKNGFRIDQYGFHCLDDQLHKICNY